MVAVSCKKDDGEHNFAIPVYDYAVLQCNNYPAPQDTYNYPVKPGTAAWSNLPTADAKWLACKIPDSILLKMQTQALIQSWLDFPLRSDIFTASSLQFGMNYMMQNFSGLVELTKRPDNEEALLERYTIINPGCIQNYTTLPDIGSFSLNIMYLEALMAQDLLLNKSTALIRKQLVSEGLKKYKFKEHYSNNAINYAQADFGLSLYVCAKAMKASNYQPLLTAISNSTNLKQFIETAYFPAGITDKSPDMQLLIQLSTNFIN